MYCTLHLFLYCYCIFEEKVTWWAIYLFQFFSQQSSTTLKQHIIKMHPLEMYFKVLLDKDHVFSHFYFGAWTSLTKCFLHYFYDKLPWPNELITSSNKYNWSLKLIFFLTLEMIIYASREFPQIKHSSVSHT